MSIKQRPPSSGLQTGWLGFLAAPLLALASQTAIQFVRRPWVPSLALRAGVADRIQHHADGVAEPACLSAGLGIHAAVFNAVASVSVDLIEADLFGIGGGRVQRDRTGDKGQAKETFPIGSRGHTQNSVSGAARIQNDRERLVPTSRLVPCGYLYRLTGVISRKAARGPGRGERHRLSQPIRLP